MKRASSEELGLLTALSRAIGVRALYPGGHPSVADAVARVVASLQGCLASRGAETVSFLALEGEVFLDDRPLRSETLHLTPFVRTLERLGIQRLTLGAGLTADEVGALVGALASAGELAESPHVEVGRVRVTGSVGGGPGVGPAAWPGAGGPGASGAVGHFGEGLLDRAEEVFGGFTRAQGGAAGRLDALVWQLIEGLGATSRSFLLLAPIRSADRAFFVHSLHVALLALAQARSLGLTGITLHEIGVAAMLHDVGKLSLPRALRERRGRLSDREWEEMKLHPELGAAWLAATDGVPRLAMLVAYEHHLRWDGKPSFPRPARPRIPNLASQMTAVADTWDALVSERYATPGVGRQAAIEAWRRRAGTWLDPFLVGNFLLLMEDAHRL